MPALPVAFQMIARRAGAKRVFAALMSHLAQQAFQGIAKAVASAGRKSAHGPDQDLERIVREDRPRLIREV